MARIGATSRNWPESMKVIIPTVAIRESMNKPARIMMPKKITSDLISPRTSALTMPQPLSSNIHHIPSASVYEEGSLGGDRNENRQRPAYAGAVTGGRMRGLPARKQLNPDSVWVLHERLAPPADSADFAGTDGDLDAFARQFRNGSIEVVHVEREVVEFLAVDVGKTESTAFSVPVQFEELVPAGAPQGHDFSLRGRRRLPLLDHLHPQAPGVEPEGFVHVLDADARVLQAIGAHSSSNRLGLR